MTRQQTTKYFCDYCGKSVDDERQRITYYNDTDLKPVDVCIDCAKKLLAKNDPNVKKFPYPPAIYIVMVGGDNAMLRGPITVKATLSEAKHVVLPDVTTGAQVDVADYEWTHVAMGHWHCDRTDAHIYERYSPGTF